MQSLKAGCTWPAAPQPFSLSRTSGIALKALSPSRKGTYAALSQHHGISCSLLTQRQVPIHSQRAQPVSRLSSPSVSETQEALGEDRACVLRCGSRQWHHSAVRAGCSENRIRRPPAATQENWLRLKGRSRSTSWPGPWGLWVSALWWVGGTSAPTATPSGPCWVSLRSLAKQIPSERPPLPTL